MSSGARIRRWRFPGSPGGQWQHPAPSLPCPSVCPGHTPPQSSPPGPLLGEAQGWWGRCSWEDANSAQGGEAGPGSVPPSRSAPRPCLHNWLVTLDKPETSHSLLGNGFCRVKPRLEHGTQLALNNPRPWEALCGTWAIHAIHWLSTMPVETIVKSNDHSVSLWHSVSLNAVLLPLWSVSLPGIPAPQGPGTREAPCIHLGSSSCVLYSRSGPCSVWDVHMGIPREPHKTRKGCFIVPISRRWKLRLRKGGSTAQAHPLKVTLQRNDRAEVQIQLPLMSKTPSQVAALLLLDPGVCGTKVRECLGQPGMPGPFSAPTCQTLQGAVRGVGSVTSGRWGTCAGGSVGTVGGRECRGEGRRNLDPVHIMAVVPWSPATRLGTQSDPNPRRMRCSHSAA